MATFASRQHMLAVMDWLVREEPAIGYRQYRPMTTRGLREQQLLDGFRQGRRITMDCSEAATLVCRLAGLDDPCGEHFNGYGNTVSMLKNPLLKHYTDPAGAGVGALVVFGPHDDAMKQHVAVVHTPGKDPLLFSHGGERGPLFIALSEERKYHEPPVTFLSVTRL